MPLPPVTPLGSEPPDDDGLEESRTPLSRRVGRGDSIFRLARRRHAGIEDIAGPGGASRLGTRLP